MKNLLLITMILLSLSCKGQPPKSRTQESLDYSSLFDANYNELIKTDTLSIKILINSSVSGNDTLDFGIICAKNIKRSMDSFGMDGELFNYNTTTIRCSLYALLWDLHSKMDEERKAALLKEKINIENRLKEINSKLNQTK